MADPVQLTDLDVIARYSIAVRSATADRDELLETLRADVAWLERGRSRTSTSAFRQQAASDDADDDAADEAPARPVRKAATAKRAAPRRTAR
ncbi:MAG TPA: hypothetical protein VHC43_09510 [Mycobacteriales bacterium]|nr:hypothetical protein [Mycobacteriales bacterium]